MTPNTNIVWLAEVRKIRDRALDARNRMDLAGEDDAAYNAASEDLTWAKAGSIAGGKAQFGLLCAYIEDSSLAESPEVERLVRSIGDLLTRLSARSAG